VLAKKKWRKPEVKRIAAGAAEKGPVNSFPDGVNPNKS
jgi:hypothetical protein